MNDGQKRAVRTLLQAAAGAISSGALDALLGGRIDNEWLPVVATILTTVIASAQNWLEDTGRVRAVLKDAA